MQLATNADRALIDMKDEVILTTKLFDEVLTSDNLRWPRTKIKNLVAPGVSLINAIKHAVSSHSY